MSLEHYFPDNFRADDNLATLLLQAKNTVSEAINAQLAEHGVSCAQWNVLSRLASDGMHTAADLCRMLNLDTGSMTRMLDRLEDKHLLQRIRSDEDRRAVQLELTGEGRALIPKLREAVCKGMNQSLRHLAPDDVAELRALLLRLVGKPV